MPLGVIQDNQAIIDLKRKLRLFTDELVDNHSRENKRLWKSYIYLQTRGYCKDDTRRQDMFGTGYSSQIWDEEVIDKAISIAKKVAARALYEQHEGDEANARLFINILEEKRCGVNNLYNALISRSTSGCYILNLPFGPPERQTWCPSPIFTCVTERYIKNNYDEDFPSLINDKSELKKDNQRKEEEKKQREREIIEENNNIILKLKEEEGMFLLNYFISSKIYCS